MNEIELLTLNFTHGDGGYSWIAIYAGGMLHTQGQHEDLEVDREIVQAINSTGSGVQSARCLTFDHGSTGSEWFNDLMRDGGMLPDLLTDIPDDVLESARDISSDE